MAGCLVNDVLSMAAQGYHSPQKQQSQSPTEAIIHSSFSGKCPCKWQVKRQEQEEVWAQVVLLCTLQDWQGEET